MHAIDPDVDNDYSIVAIYRALLIKAPYGHYIGNHMRASMCN